MNMLRAETKSLHPRFFGQNATVLFRRDPRNGTHAPQPPLLFAAAPWMRAPLASLIGICPSLPSFSPAFQVGRGWLTEGHLVGACEAALVGAPSEILLGWYVLLSPASLGFFNHVHLAPSGDSLCSPFPLGGIPPFPFEGLP